MGLVGRHTMGTPTKKIIIILIICHNAVQDTLTHFTHITGLTQALLMTGHQLRHTGHTLPCPLCQVTTPKNANGSPEWSRVCAPVSEWASEWKRLRELSVQSPLCACVHVKTHRMCIATSDSGVAELNISCRYELTVKFSCSRSSWVRVSAIVSSEASQRIERNSPAWHLVRVASLPISSLLTDEITNKFTQRHHAHGAKNNDCQQAPRHEFNGLWF